MAGRKSVWFVSSGGRTAQGGMGRVAEYVARHWQDGPDAASLPLGVIDTYGPGPLWKMPFYWLGALATVFFLCLTGRAALFHVNVSQKLSLWRKGSLIVVARAFGVPVVLHCHGSRFAEYFNSRSPAGKRRVIWLFRQAHSVLTLGSYWTEFMTRHLGLPASQVITLPNAVPGPAEVPRRETPPPVRMVFLGRIGERKGVPCLLRALAAPSLASLDWQITIAGDGEVEEARAEAARLGLAGRTSFPGWSSEADVRRLLAQSHIMVLPSRNEGLPMAVLEAMAWQTAVVTTPVGSIPDAITHRQNGLLVTVDDTNDLAHALAELIRSPEMRENLAVAARQTFLDKFDIAPYIVRLGSIYRKAIDDSHRS